MCRTAKLGVQEHEVDVVVEGCMFWHSTQELHKEGIPPFTCVPMMIAEAALHKRLGKKAHFVGVKYDNEKRQCDIDFHLV